MRFLAALPFTKAKLTPNSRANLRTEGLACEVLPSLVTTLSPTGNGRCAGCTCFGGSGAGRDGSGIATAIASFGAATGAGALTSAAGALAAAASASKIKIKCPCAILSPTFNFTSLTTPANGAGISIDALSDSTVTSESSLAIVSPALTSTSITSTLSKLPISGTKTSCKLLIIKYLVFCHREHRVHRALI